MFNNVIAAVDGREGGRDAIALAESLRAKDGQLSLAYVYRGESQVWRGTSPPYDVAERQRAFDMLEQAREEAGLEAELRLGGSDSVGRGLHELAEAIGADLLVVGTSRRGLLGRVLVGDDTRAALNGAPCAIAIATAGYSQRPPVMREIGVGYDGSPESEHALGVARRLAAAHHTKLSAFEAVGLPAYERPGWVALTTIPEMVDAARERLSALDGVEAHAAYGQAAEELALFSASLDLLVIGSRGYGPLGRLVHGSVAQHLARAARCPLLVLTRAAREADRTAAAEGGREGAAQAPASAPRT